MAILNEVVSEGLSAEVTAGQGLDGGREKCCRQRAGGRSVLGASGEHQGQQVRPLRSV